VASESSTLTTRDWGPKSFFITPFAPVTVNATPIAVE
jgi:hypothetical protein